MPNDTLIDALQALRDDYAQKQKVTHSLLLALKGKSSALGKVQQSLGDYATNNPNPQPQDETLQPVQQLFASAQENISPLIMRAAREAKTLATLNGSLKAILSALNTNPVDVVKLSHPFEALKNVELQDERIIALLPELEHELDQAQQSLGIVFGAALRDAFNLQGIAVAGTSPKFEAGQFEINANFLTRMAFISFGKEVVVKRVALSVEAILNAYQWAAKRITGRDEDPDTWMAQFYNAWEAARRKRDASNPRANVVDCYFELVLLRQPKTFFSAPSKNGFAEYTRAQFAYDLQEIAIRPHRSLKGLVVFAHSGTRSQTDSSTRSIWVVEGIGPHDGRYVGDIVFDKMSKG